MRRIREEEYRKAYEIWEQTHKEDSIKITTTVTLENGAVIRLGKRINNMKLSKEKLTPDQKKYWEEKGVFERKRQRATEEEYREAYRIWKEEHPTKTHIRRDEKVTIESGKVVHIGQRVCNMKALPEKMSEEQKEYWNSQGVLERCLPTEKEYEEAYKIWKKSHPEAVYMKKCEKVTIKSGKVINIGARIDNISSHPERLSKDQRKYWTKKGVIESPKEQSIYNFHQEESLETIWNEYLLRLHGDENKAYWIVKCLKETRKKEVSVENLALIFDKTEEELIKFCLFKDQNDLHKNLLSIARLHMFCPNDTLEQLKNRILLTKRNKRPSNWIYAYYGNHIESILKWIGLDEKKILKQMSEEIIPLEEAVCDAIFKSTEKLSKYEWIEVPLQFLKDKMNSQNNTYQVEKSLFSFVKKYHLNKEEGILLQKCLLKYLSTINEYYKTDVGLERRMKEKIEKIRKYHLSSDDIEESFFIPLEIKRQEGNGQQIYDRKELLRQYTIDWNYYKNEEKKQVIVNENMTEREVRQINRKRKIIDKTIEVGKTLVKK